MTPKQIDRLLLTLGVLLIIFGGYRFAVSPKLTKKLSTSLGVLQSVTGTVRTKGAADLDWKISPSGVDVRDQHILTTDADSSAKLLLVQGPEIQIHEGSSLTVLKSGLILKNGLLEVKLSHNVPLSVSLGELLLKFSSLGSEFQIVFQKETAEIGILRGEVVVEVNGKPQTLTPAQYLRIEKGSDRLREVTMQTTAPARAQTIYTLTDTEKVNFTWTPETRAEVLVATNPMLKQARVFRGSGSATADLAPDTYYWRVEEIQGSSLTGSFTVVKEVPPTILRPINGNTILLSREEVLPGILFLQWKGKSNESYFVEWIDEATHEKSVTIPSALIPMARSGEVSWRLRVDAPERPLAQWSEWQKLAVTVIHQPSVPENLIPDAEDIISYKPELSVELSWGHSVLSEVEVKGADFDQRFEVPGPSHVLTLKKAGAYKWRIRGKDQFRRLSAWSEWKSFVVQDFSKDVSDDHSARIEMKKADQSVTFFWQADPGTTTVFELSTTRDFANVIIQKEVPGSETTVIIPGAGDYFWRSRQSLSGSNAPVKVLSKDHTDAFDANIL